MEFREIYEEVFQKNQLGGLIKEEYIEKFQALTEIMLKTNEVMNITALTTLEKIIPLHYADCVTVADWIPQGASVLDVGCGGGFPSLPLAIVRPDLRITGIDSTEKKVRYVENTAKELGLNVKAISARAEELAQKQEHREAYDIVLSRAVARMNVLSELCIPFVKVGGYFIAMKGAAGDTELAEASNAVSILGGSVEKCESQSLYTLSEAETRKILIIKKESATPVQYPRGFGAIKKKPL